MTKRSQSKKSIPKQIETLIEKLGSNIQIARKRRKMTQKELAARAFCSIPTINRLEKGDSGVSLNILAQVLWVLGLQTQLLKVADPEKDRTGFQEDLQNMPTRIKKSLFRKKKMDF
ncbi:MAG: helix-turn-helix domain-containing protein [Desulfobacteraceae bacterium]|nr:helix-turn-helix domain-containing protein [Desulfobacteraceae bacterium]